ncbi:MAG: AraC family transcriptional regulator [Lachnospiraceae bacterium]|nr:AraC family transcriptional regulator [Lachnospiraceae bacterium]
MQVLDIQINEQRQEVTPHGDFSFPLVVYHTILSRNILGFVDWHWHEDVQFYLVTHGAIRVYVDHRSYVVPEGDGFFINSNELHMVRPEGPPDSSYICVDADAHLIAGFWGSVVNLRYVQPYLRHPQLPWLMLEENVDWQKEILDMVRQTYVIDTAKGFGYEMDIAILVKRMWIQLIRNFDFSSGKSSHSAVGSEHVQNMIAYIRENSSSALTIEQIAKAVGLSGSECCRTFKKVTGSTIFSYVQTCRLAEAVELLLHSEDSISQIAYETGFCSTSYFIEIFKKQMGTTPLKYRKARQAERDAKPPAPDEPTTD